MVPNNVLLDITEYPNPGCDLETESPLRHYAMSIGCPVGSHAHDLTYMKT